MNSKLFIGIFIIFLLIFPLASCLTIPQENIDSSGSGSASTPVAQQDISSGSTASADSSGSISTWWNSLFKKTPAELEAENAALRAKLDAANSKISDLTYYAVKGEHPVLWAFLYYFAIPLILGYILKIIIGSICAGFKEKKGAVGAIFRGIDWFLGLSNRYMILLQAILWFSFYFWLFSDIKFPFLFWGWPLLDVVNFLVTWDIRIASAMTTSTIGVMVLSFGIPLIAIFLLTLLSSKLRDAYSKELRESKIGKFVKNLKTTKETTEAVADVIEEGAEDKD